MRNDSILNGLLSPQLWERLLELYTQSHGRKKEKISSFRNLHNSGELMKLVDAVLDCSYRHSPPELRLINRHGQSGKKTVFLLDYRDELVCKGVNRILISRVSRYLSPLCHSFRPGMGAKSAFGRIIRDTKLSEKAVLKIDIRSFFNSIDVENFLETLPAEFKTDPPLFTFLGDMLRQNLVYCHGVPVNVQQKGLMAGTPLAPLLSNLYLRDLDLYFEKQRVTYARYCDDIIVFDNPDAIDRHGAYIREYLAQKKLAVNEKKSAVLTAGCAWEFLGLRYDGGTIDLAAHTLYKFRGKLRRLANRYDRLRLRKELAGETAVRWLLKRLNRKFYGIGHDSGDLCWSRWFFPMLTHSETLHVIDALVQEKLRFVAAGRHSKKSYKCLDYGRMKALGYYPLVSAYHLYRKDAGAFFSLIAGGFGTAETKEP